MLARALIAAVLAFCAAPAHADQNWTCQAKVFTMPGATLPHCSRAFALVGVCNANDQVAANEFVPWEPFPIIIDSIGVAFITNDVIVGGQAGNGYMPDMMLMLGYGEKSGHREFPAGTGMLLPAADPGNQAKGWYVDMHFGCTGNTANHTVGLYEVGYHPFAPNP